MRQYTHQFGKWNIKKYGTARSTDSRPSPLGGQILAPSDASLEGRNLPKRPRSEASIQTLSSYESKTAHGHLSGKRGKIAASSSSTLSVMEPTSPGFVPVSNSNCGTPDFIPEHSVALDIATIPTSCSQQVDNAFQPMTDVAIALQGQPMGVATYFAAKSPGVASEEVCPPFPSHSPPSTSLLVLTCSSADYLARATHL